VAGTVTAPGSLSRGSRVESGSLETAGLGASGLLRAAGRGAWRSGGGAGGAAPSGDAAGAPAAERDGGGRGIARPGEAPPPEPRGCDAAASAGSLADAGLRAVGCSFSEELIGCSH